MLRGVGESKHPCRTPIVVWNQLFGSAAVPVLPNISLISHPSTVILKIKLNRLKPQVEKIIAEEQAGFRSGRSTSVQIFILRILCERYLQHQQDPYHVFVDFKKAFDRVWHLALWATMKYNISTNPIRQVITHMWQDHQRSPLQRHALTQHFFFLM